MFQIIGVVIQVIAPAHNQLSRENTEGDEICRTFPPIMRGKEPSDRGY
jgi:hypothetical protein